MRSHRAGFFFCGGVAVGIAGLSFFAWTPSVLVFVGALLLAISAFLHRPAETLCVAAAACGVAFGTMRGASSFGHWQTLPLPESPYAGEVRVAAYPENKTWNREVILEPVACAEGAACVTERILWRTSFFEPAVFGERFSFSCALAFPENFDPSFDYRSFLNSRGIGYVCESGSRGPALEPTRFEAALLIFGSVRARIERTLSEILPEPEAGLGKGLLLGGSGFLPAETALQFQRIGMTHIVAVSGYNIMLVAEAALFMGIFLWLWRGQALFAAGVAVCLFVLFVGAPSSAVRAGVMAAFGIAALHTGRLQAPFRPLAYAAILMLLWNPLLLRYDAGFQLSVLAVLGIVFSLDGSAIPAESSGVRRFLSEAVRVTLWAQLFVWPLLMYHFGLFSWFSFIANILILPLVPLSMLGSLLVAVLGSLWPAGAILYAWFAYLPLRLITFASEYFSSFSWVAVNVPEFPAWLLIPCYAGLIFIGLRRMRARQKRWYAEAFTVAPRPGSSRHRRVGGALLSLDAP